MPSTDPRAANESSPRASGPSPLAWSGVLTLIGAAGLLSLGVFSLFQAVRTAEERARVEARRTASVTARTLRAALGELAVLELFQPEMRFAVEGGRVVVPPDVGWLDPPPEDGLPDALPADARKLVARSRRAEFRDRDHGRALEHLRAANRSESLRPRHREWIALAAANCAQRADDKELRDMLLDGLITNLGGTSRERPLDDVVCGLLILCAKSGRSIPASLTALLPRVPPDVAKVALTRAAEVQESALAKGVLSLRGLGKALDEVVAWRERLRRVRRLLPRLLSSNHQVLTVDDDFLFFFGRAPAAGEGAIVDSRSLPAILDRERARADGPLAAVGTSGRLLCGAEVSAVPEAFPVVAPRLAIAPYEPAPGGIGSHWRLIVSVAALAIFLLVGIGVALRAMHKEQLHTRARADFLTAVTHELKTPLASIRLLVDVLRERRASDEKRLQYHERLAGEAARLTMLVENVLDLGRIERKERGYDRRQEDLTDIVRGAVALYRPLASRDGMEFAVELDEAPVTAEVDRGALTQVLLNIFENARRYASTGQWIEVTGRRAEERFRLVVRDRGLGVPAAEREAIFEKFGRGGSTGKTNREDAGSHEANPGIGLGLFLARAIARDHGGDLRCVAPADGGGACFELTLPVEPAPSEGKARGTKTTEMRAAERIREEAPRGPVTP